MRGLTDSGMRKAKTMVDTLFFCLSIVAGWATALIIIIGYFKLEDLIKDLVREWKDKHEPQE